ncbi:MAG: porin family protein, partial [Bacteroidota bacterium]
MKVSILFIALLIGVFGVNAQSLHLGLKAGANMNKLSGMPFDEKFSFSYHAGAYAQIGLGKKFAIQPEVLFSQVTADTSDQFNDILKPGLSNIILKYLTIPLLLNYKAGPILDIQAGPQYGILLDQNKSL